MNAKIRMGSGATSILCAGQFLVLLALCAGVWAESKPWTLRSTYTFPHGNGRFEIDKQSAEWRFTAADDTVLISDTGFLIEFADGSTWTQQDLGIAEHSRDPFNNALGEGTVYSTTFPVKSGLHIRYEVTNFVNRPFLLLRIHIKNEGADTVRLKAIRPVVFQPDGKGLATEGVQPAFRAVEHQGAFPVVGVSNDRQLVVFNIEKHDLHFALGMLPSGISRTELDFAPANGFWQGSALCDLDPGLNIAPGAEYSTDAVWTAFGLGDAASYDLYYAWIMSERRVQSPALGRIRAWSTVSESGNVGDLIATGRDWQTAGVKHALIPAGWEGKPGSLEGAAPRYPKRIRAAAAEMAGAGLVPGITIDPLLFDGGANNFSAATTDGQRWLNPQLPDGQRAIRSKIETLREAGFEFVVVEPSRIPSGILAAFETTRAAADFSALNAIMQAAESMPVYPQARGVSVASGDALLEASAAVSRFDRFGVKVGPIPIDGESLGAPDADLITALRIWPGPVELHGKCTNNARRVCGDVFGRASLPAMPMDVDVQSPRIWQLSATSPSLGYLGSALLTFRGAGGYALSDLALENGTPHRFWRSADGAEIQLSEKLAHTHQEPQIIGASPVVNRPALLGLSNDTGLHLDRIADIVWNEREGSLTGKIDGPVSEGAVAYIFIPETWVLTSGKVGKTSVKSNLEGRMLAMPIGSGGATFDLQFKRQS